MTLYTTAEVAEKLGLSVQRIRQVSGTVGIKKGRDWLFSEADVEYIKSRIGKRGKPVE